MILWQNSMSFIGRHSEAFTLCDKFKVTDNTFQIFRYLYWHISKKRIIDTVTDTFIIKKYLILHTYRIWYLMKHFYQDMKLQRQSNDSKNHCYYISQ